jgi:hypothetical protein
MVYVDSLKNYINNDSTLIMEGSSYLANLSIFETIREIEGSDEGLINQNTDHPDILFVDCRETDTGEIRELRSNVTQVPSRLNFRYLILNQLDRLHPTALQTLLKLMEEHPDHLKLIMSTKYLKRLIPTIISRSSLVKIPKLELGRFLEIVGPRGNEHLYEISLGDPDIAFKMDPILVKDWEDEWSSFLASVAPKGFFSIDWSNRIKESSEETQIVIWNIPIKLISDKHINSFDWREISLVCLKERERVMRGKSSEISARVTLAHVYQVLRRLNEGD